MKCETKCDGPLTLREPSLPPSKVGIDWLARWQEVAQGTDGLLPDDPRVDPVLTVVAECNRCHKTQNVDGFMTSTARIRRLMAFVPGATIRWEGIANQRLMILGPATVEYVHHDDGKLYVFVVWQGTERWVSETSITTVERP
jgi:hypothetical protein